MLFLGFWCEDGDSKGFHDGFLEKVFGFATVGNEDVLHEINRDDLLVRRDPAIRGKSTTMAEAADGHGWANSLACRIALPAAGVVKSFASSCDWRSHVFNALG